MSETASPIIELRHITKQFPGVRALDNVSMTFYPGQVHAILGENGAGKSTLINILAGELQPDSGQIVFQGQPQVISDPHVSQQLGISVVYQELALCPNLSIAENIALNTAAQRSPLAFINRRQFQGSAREALARLGMVNVDVRRPVGRLSVAQQQMVEIAKAISQNARILILDEPNSALTIEETEQLFTVLRQLRSEGVAIIYISHRLEEVLRIADIISVMRDGRHIDTSPNDATTTIDGLIAKMVGRSLEHFYERQITNTAREAAALEVSDIVSEAVNGVSFSVRQGEIVGVAGLPDSGKDELVSCLFGLASHEGTVRVAGHAASITSPASAIRQGLALIPADRRGSGAILVMSVQDNIVTSVVGDLSPGGLLRRGALRSVGERYVRDLDVRIASMRQKMGTLSGGNQQKVILGRGLATKPAVLLLHEPTRGIDVGAKAEIYTILQQLAADGVGILIVSSELPELISQCDRILVMHAGRITGEFDRASATEEAILACAMGQAASVQGRA